MLTSRLLQTVQKRALSSSTLRFSTQHPFHSHYGAFINGHLEKEERPGATYFDVENPATGEVLAKCLDTSPEMVHQAIERGNEVFEEGIWSRESPKVRGEVMMRVGALLRERIEEFALKESWQTGRPIREMKAQLGRLPEWFEYFGSLVRVHEGTVPPFSGNFVNYVNRVPLGVVGLITPWNHPLLIAIKKLAPALATGNSVVLKPSELAPFSVLELGETLFNEAGLPEGVCSILPGLGPSVGQEIVSHPLLRKVDLTGGTVTGRHVGAMAGRNLCHMTSELGGKSPMVVFEDAVATEEDLQGVVNGLAFGSFIASGQTCIMGSRLLIQRSVYDKVMDRLQEKVQKAITMGDPFLTSTQMGPVISRASLDKIKDFVRRAEEEGATVLTGGNQDLDDKMAALSAPFTSGFYYPPTLISDVTPDMNIVKEEIFGPVVVCYPFDDEAEAVALANDSEFGLACSIWTEDIKRGHRMADRINAGIIWLNDHHKNDPSSPWGGMKDSGIGRENGLNAFHEYTQTKSVIVSYDQQRVDWFVEEAVRYS